MREVYLPGEDRGGGAIQLVSVFDSNSMLLLFLLYSKRRVGRNCKVSELPGRHLEGGTERNDQRRSSKPD
jgi:hypothetical protein